jgi:hypothetical protein
MTRALNSSLAQRLDVIVLIPFEDKTVLQKPDPTGGASPTA